MELTVGMIHDEWERDRIDGESVISGGDIHALEVALFDDVSLPGATRIDQDLLVQCAQGHYPEREWDRYPDVVRRGDPIAAARYALAIPISER